MKTLTFKKSQKKNMERASGSDVASSQFRLVRRAERTDAASLPTILLLLFYFLFCFFKFYYRVSAYTAFVCCYVECKEKFYVRLLIVERHISK